MCHTRHILFFFTIARNYLVDSVEKCIFAVRIVMFAGDKHKFAVHEHKFSGGEHKFAEHEYKIDSAKI